MTPDDRAENLLTQVLGESRYRRLKDKGELWVPSELVPGRMYRLYSTGKLELREVGQDSFATDLCIQAEQTLPRADQVALKYLLLTTNEDYLVKTANHITFGFFSLARAIYHDFCRCMARPAACLATVTVLGMFFAADYAVVWCWTHMNLLTGLLGVLAFVPGFVGAIMGCALIADANRLVCRWLYR